MIQILLYIYFFCSLLYIGVTLSVLVPLGRLLHRSGKFINSLGKCQKVKFDDVVERGFFCYFNVVFMKKHRTGDSGLNNRPFHGDEEVYTLPKYIKDRK